MKLAYEKRVAFAFHQMPECWILLAIIVTRQPSHANDQNSRQRLAVGLLVVLALSAVAWESAAAVVGEFVVRLKEIKA